jgi:hypothetical protein
LHFWSKALIASGAKDSGLTLGRVILAAAISSTLSALPILAPDLFGEVASGKNRTQNYCKQDYPASGRHDREDQAASPRH